MADRRSAVAIFIEKIAIATQFLLVCSVLVINFPNP